MTLSPRAPAPHENPSPPVDAWSRPGKQGARSFPALHLFLAAELLAQSRVTLSLLIAAIALGTGFQIPNSANIDGYTAELIEKGVIRATGHVLVTPPGNQGRLSHAREQIEKLRSLPEVKAVAPRSYHVGVLLSEKGERAVRVVGVDPGLEHAATQLCHRIDEGSCLDAASENAALVGHELAAEMAIAPGQTFRLLLVGTARSATESALVRPRTTGVLQGGGMFSEDKDVIVPSRWLHRALGMSDDASALMVFGNDPSAARVCADAVTRVLPAARVRAWNEGTDFVNQAIRGNRRLATVSLGMVILAVAIPVLALLYVHVLSERKQIGVLRALGMTVRDIFFVYLLKAAIVGVVGVLVGLGLGLGLSAYFDRFPLFESGGFVVRPLLTPQALLLPSAILLATSIVAGILPAWVAARTEVIDQLRKT